MKKWRNKILSAVLVLSLLLTSSSFAFAVGDDGTTEENLEQIPCTQLSVKGFSSQQYEPENTSDLYKDEGPAKNAIDGNYNNFWHTIWTGTDSTTGINHSEDREKYIIIDLGKPVYLKQIKVYQRQDSGTNDRESVRIKDYGVYLSLDGKTFSENPEMSGSFENTAQTNTLTFNEPVYTQYVKFQDTNWDKEFATLAELEFFKDNSKTTEGVPTIDAQPQSQVINDFSDIKPFTVTATGDHLSYQWYKSADSNINNGATLENATNNTYIPNDVGYYFAKITNTTNNNYVYSNIVKVELSEAKIVGTDKCGTLSAMIKEAEDGQTIEVCRNIVIERGITIDKDLTITSAEGESHFVIKRGSNYKNALFTVTAPNKNIVFKNITIDGGAIWSESGEKNTTLNRSQVNEGITATQPMIVITRGTVSFMENSVLQNNENTIGDYGEGNNGGAIRINANNATEPVKVILNGATIRNNSCNNFGGAIAEFTPNKSENQYSSEIEMINADIYGNYSKYGGGAVLADQSSKFVVESGNIYHNLTTVTDDNRGGGVVWIGSGEFTVNGGSIYENTSTHGGVVFINGGVANINGGDIRNNNATISGGVVYIKSGSANINGGDIRNNNATTSGGVVYIKSGSANVGTGAVLNANSAPKGGAIYVNAGSLTVGEATISDNTSSTDGGAINIAGGTATVGAATISGNSANWGGAVYVGGGTADFTDTIITENRATEGRGGAFNINKVSSDIATTVNINGNTQIFKNSASAHGGAINIQNGTVNLNGGLISENTAAQNGGAIYLGFSDGFTSGNGTLNLGSSGNDFALTISGNTATKGDDIYYGENGTFNINAKLNLNNLFLSMNSGKTPNINCDLLGNAPIKVTIASDRPGRDVVTKGAELSEDSYSNSLNVFRVYDLSTASGTANSYKSTYKNNNVLSINDTLSLEKELSSSIYLKGIDNNLFTVTGSENITYTWYKKAPDSNQFTEVGKNLDSLSDGTHTVYCVAKSSDGKYMVSDVATVTVQDFVPCSQAIAKFKGI